MIDSNFGLIRHQLVMLQVWNIQAQAELTLNGPVGQVHAMVVGNNMVFAGIQVITLTLLSRFYDLISHWFRGLLCKNLRILE